MFIILLGLQQQSTSANTGLPPPYSLGVGQATGGLQLGTSNTGGLQLGATTTGGLMLGGELPHVPKYDHWSITRHVCVIDLFD